MASGGTEKPITTSQLKISATGGSNIEDVPPVIGVKSAPQEVNDMKQMKVVEEEAPGTEDSARRASAEAVFAWLADGDKVLSVPQAIFVLVTCIVPNVAVVVILSDIGRGIEVYNTVAPRSMSLAGDLAILMAAISITALYISDWAFYKSTCLKGCTAALPVMLITAGAFLKGRKYPWAPLLFILFLIPLVLGIYRFTFLKKTRRKAFYTWVSASTALCGLLLISVFLAWVFLDNHEWNRAMKDDLAARSKELYEHVYADKALEYELHCHPDKNQLSSLDLDKKEKSAITAACGRAAAVWFLVWTCPMLAAICNWVLSVFCFMHGVSLNTKESDKLARTMKQFLICLVFLFGGMYCSVSITSLALGSTFMAFFAAALCILCVWTILEVGAGALKKMAKGSKTASMLASAFRSDWVRAIFVGAINIFIPVYFSLNSIKQRVRKYRGTNGDSNGRYTAVTQKLVNELDKWNWCSILTKVAILGELFFMLQVGVSKVTYIFLSWLCELLSDVNFGVVIVLVIAVGYTMFLLPPVPGVPVYVFSGIVITDQARRKLGDNGFIKGILIAVVVGFINKLLACLGQYGIGYFLGQKVKVQQLIAVDSVPTRAIEMVLKRPGLDIGKVAILIGGPDWPTSVTCGILKLNIPQMLLGTLPVVLILSPCVLAGAFIASQGSGGEDSIWPMLANMATIFAMVCQLAAGLTATVCIVKTIQDHNDELVKPRQEHAAVAELTRKGEVARRAYTEVTQWSKLGKCDKVILIGCVAFHLISGFMFVMLAEACFLPFSVDKSIDAPVEEGGLGGDPFAIIVAPYGYIGLALFFIAVFLHILHCQMMSHRARKKLKSDQSSAETAEGGVSNSSSVGKAKSNTSAGPRPRGKE